MKAAPFCEKHNLEGVDRRQYDAVFGLGACVTCTASNPSSTPFYEATTPEYIGALGVRIELFSEPFNLKPQGGWYFCDCGLTGYRFDNEAEAEEIKARIAREGCRCS